MSGGIYLVRGDDELVEMRERPYEAEDVLQALIARFPSLDLGITAIVLRSAPNTGIGLDDLIAEGPPGPWCADQNGDGVVDLLDTVILRRILAGAPVASPP